MRIRGEGKEGVDGKRKVAVSVGLGLFCTQKYSPSVQDVYSSTV